MFEASLIDWAATLGIICCLVAFDLWWSRRAPHAIGLREAAGWSAFYVLTAVAFGVVFGTIAGWDVGTQYFAGYIVEKSLSVDNLFVFVIIMSTFAVPAEQQGRLLMIGIVGALILRAAFIAVGAAMLETFSFTYLLFGVALTATAVQLFRHRDADPSVDDNLLVTGVRRFLPVARHYDGGRFVTRTGGRRTLTPLCVALVAIASTDLLFALDSIPAVFGVTPHAYVVFAANAFALLGLRALFFLVSGLLDRLVYLSTGLALILAFIGVKLVLHFGHLHIEEVPSISTGVSLAVIVTVLCGAATASAIKVRRDPAARAHAGLLLDPDHTGATRSTAAGGASRGSAGASPGSGGTDRGSRGPDGSAVGARTQTSARLSRRRSRRSRAIAVPDTTTRS
jgi:tellurite resistance protein TerC